MTVTKLRDILDVRDFGAKPVTGFDNSQPFQDAINVAKLQNISRVYAPSGIWGVSSTVIVDSNALVFEGAGWADIDGLEGTVVQALPGFTGTEVFRFDSGLPDGRPLLGAGLKGLQVRGDADNATATAGVRGVYARVARGKFWDLMISKSTGDGLFLEGASAGNGDPGYWATYDTHVVDVQTFFNQGDGFVASEFSADDLHVRSLITGSNVGNGATVAGASAQFVALHSYDNGADGLEITNARCKIGGVSKIEGNGEHGLNVNSGNGSFVSGLMVNSVGFKDNSQKTANTFDDMIINVSTSDGPWQVNGCQFSQVGGIAPRFGLNIANNQITQGNVVGNVFSGTYGTGRINFNTPTPGGGFENIVKSNTGIPDQ